MRKRSGAARPGGSPDIRCGRGECGRWRDIQSVRGSRIALSLPVATPTQNRIAAASADPLLQAMLAEAARGLPDGFVKDLCQHDLATLEAHPGQKIAWVRAQPDHQVCPPLQNPQRLRLSPQRPLASGFSKGSGGLPKSSGPRSRAAAGHPGHASGRQEQHKSVRFRDGEGGRLGSRRGPSTVRCPPGQQIGRGVERS